VKDGGERVAFRADEPFTQLPSIATPPMPAIAISAIEADTHL
jgi:hypothetical protein